MKAAAVFTLTYTAILSLLIVVSTPPAFAQSQALNGQIEGAVSDQTGAAVANASITATNIETGATRSVTTDEGGVYRFPLLPLGTYRITVEAANFKKLIRDGVTLTTGQTATVDLHLQAGEVEQVVTVSADSSVTDAGKTDLSRVMNTREVQNLPLVTRNPYNFVFLQTNVTGRVNRGFAFPLINANGYLRRVNYLIDGNTNTQGDRGTARFVVLSDTSVGEVQLLTNSFAAEFGNTPGMIMNIVTPSGTNSFRGALGYRFRRPSFYTRPFFYASTENIPDNQADNLTAAIGAPILKDRWHSYFGYEFLRRDDKAAAERLLTIKPDDRAALMAAGLPASIFPATIPSLDRGTFYIFRSDAQLSPNNRLTARFNHTDVMTENNLLGGFNTLERSTDAININDALAVQLASYTPQILNEFRFQYAQRRATNNLGRRNERSGNAPSVTITGVANFGAPAADDSLSTLRIIQSQDNLTRTAGRHVVKFGGGFNFYSYTERSPIISSYTFSSIAAYLSARNGTNPHSYTRYEESFGDPVINYRATFWNFFVQDDFKLTRRLKLNFGLRYDLYLIPKADPNAPFPASRKFNVDKNNFAPRLGVVYALREGGRPTILRFGAGIYTDAPLFAIYRRALQNNGNPRFFNFTFPPDQRCAPANQICAPAFPEVFSGSLPPGATLPEQNIDTIALDFVNMYAIHFNFQIEQAITENLSLAAGYVHSAGRHIPVYRSINCRALGDTLADGRPVFGITTLNPQTGAITTSPCRDRIFPQFRTIQIVESAGVSEYDALTLQLTQRFSRGLQFSANYTLSKATDDAPEQNMTTGSIQGLVLSDPTNRALDKGFSFADQRHTFVMSLVLQPGFNFTNKTLRSIFNKNRVGIIANANSGERFNVISNLDLNGDGNPNSDRPAGIRRNAGKTPPQFNLDFRYSRFFRFTERYKLEISGEFQNLFNTNSIVGYNDVSVAANPFTGELIGELPDFRSRNKSIAQESRQFQLGVKFHF